MWKWLKRFWTAGDAAVRIHAVYTLLGVIATIFTALVVAMSVIANWVTDLHSNYGLGAVIFAGIGAACIIVLVISAALVAWRLFNPLPKTKNDVGGIALTAIPEPVDPTPWKADIDSMGSLVEKYIDVTAGNLQKDINSLRSDVTASMAKAVAATPWKDDIVRHDNLVLVQRSVNEGVLDQLDKLQATVKTLGERFSNHERIVASGTYMLIKALRARDAEEILLTNDKTAMSLGKRLAKATMTDYPDAASWFSDYEPWKAAVRAIDDLMFQWTKDGPNKHIFLLDLEARHYENSPMPPENIKTDDTIIKFKTVWHVQSSYANRRDGFFTFFAERAVFPG
jgi:hypothetical protein